MFFCDPIGSQYVHFADNNVHAQGREQQMANKTVQQRFIARRRRGAGRACKAWRFNSFGARANETKFTFASRAGTVNKETLSSDWLWRGNDCGSTPSATLFHFPFSPFHSVAPILFSIFVAVMAMAQWRRFFLSPFKRSCCVLSNWVDWERER